eukprot:scaffold35020_cov333-Skeletonema_dohrnii-CCMP3373.AAC.2
MSFSGVVPEEVRRDGFDGKKWKWLRDGSEDLKAGCFMYLPTILVRSSLGWPTASPDSTTISYLAL